MIISKLNTSLVNKLLDDRNIIIRSKLHYRLYNKLQTNIHNITDVEFLLKLNSELQRTPSEDFFMRLSNNLKNEL
mgnify:CR=1 FL=1